MPRNQSEIFVKVAKTGGEVKEICLNGDRTVDAALKAAGVSAGSNRIRVNGKEASLETTLKNNDRVIVSGKIQGGLE